MKLSPYLLFDGNCKEAMEFYHSVFGGELTLTLVGASPLRELFPEELHARVLNAHLSGPVADLSASDWLHPREKPQSGNLCCLYLHDGTPESTQSAFAALAEGAQVTDPLTQQPFGLYGALNDRFGVRWMFHAAGSPSPKPGGYPA